MYKILPLFLLIGLASTVMASPVCPVTSNTNSDCGYILTINADSSVTGMVVPNASPYDGNDDALIGVINNSTATFTAGISLSGSGNGGGLFAFDGDGICSYVSASYCSTAPTGYEGPTTTFSKINAAQDTGTVSFTGLLPGTSTFFSLEGSPASINGGGGPVIGPSTPEPGTISLLATGMLGLVYAMRRRRNL